MFFSINPYTDETLLTVAPHSADEVERRVELAHRTFRTQIPQRSELLKNTAVVLESRASEFARLITSEMGKTLASAEAEILKCASVCRHYAEEAGRYLAPLTIPTSATESYVTFQPLGVILAIMPWNYPFWQVFRFAAPALMAGNTCLLKHAPNVPQCALAMERIFREAGFPEGAFQTLLIETGQVEGLIAGPRIAAVTLTGSEAAGQAVGAQAGRHIKKTVLELGGSDPFIVCPGADLAKALDAAVLARVQNNGQSCIAGKRFIVLDEIYDEFETRFVKAMQSLVLGDPMHAATQIGPLALPRFVDHLETQVQRALASGAQLLTGGARSPDHPNIYQPTVLTNVARSSQIFREEFFGPVALLFRVGSIDEAIDLANDSPFGLGASVWTLRTAERQQFIDRLDSGAVFINSITASDPRLPFGGIKRSGHGRELGEFGIREFTNIKTISIA